MLFACGSGDDVSVPIPHADGAADGAADATTDAPQEGGSPEVGGGDTTGG
jgi:hypothetical protein